MSTRQCQAVVDNIRNNIKAENKRLKRELSLVKAEQNRYKGALHLIRAILGDFQEPWNEREKKVDEIADQALTTNKEEER